MHSGWHCPPSVAPASHGGLEQGPDMTDQQRETQQLDKALLYTSLFLLEPCIYTQRTEQPFGRTQLSLTYTPKAVKVRGGTVRSAVSVRSTAPVGHILD